MHEINGRWYCEDCCFWCEYHEEWEVGDRDNNSIYVENYGRVCEDALDEDCFYECEQCGYWYYDDIDDHIETEDGTHFCCESHAHRYGYMETSDGDWYPEDDVYYCEHCDRYVHENDWNSDLDCCTDCEEEVATENAVAEEVEITEAV
jgi:hypothetical protein